MTDRELFIKVLDALEYATNETKPLMEKVRVRIMSEAYDLADRNDSEGYNAVKVMCSDVLAMIKASEQGTGNLLKDAYNAMVEKKTRSQKLREAGFTRRPKGWEKEKDEQEPVAHTLNCVCGAVWDVRSDGVEEMVHAPTPLQRSWIGLTKEEAKEISLANRPYVIDMVAALEARLKEKNT